MSAQLAPDTIHIFERAGLGTAPFRCVGSYESIYKPHPDAPARPGTSCDYCGTGIMNVFEILGADGRTFKVGCECVRKTDDAGLRKAVDAIIKKARIERENTRTATALEAFRQAGDAFQNSYPCLWAKIDFLFRMGGHAGKLKAARLFKRHQAGDPEPNREAEKENHLRQLASQEDARREAEYRARQQAESDEVLARWGFLLPTLDQMGGEFVNSIATGIRAGQEPQGRAIGILENIYAANAGRKGSRAYNEAAEKFDRHINPKHYAENTEVQQ